MNRHLFFFVLWTCPVFYLGSVEASVYPNVKEEVIHAINDINQQLERDLTQGDISKVMDIYAENAIYMPEYQPTLNGVQKIHRYFEQLNARRKIQSINFNADEMLNLEDYVLEIGTFETSIDWSTNQVSKTQRYKGKYWRIWSNNTTLKVLGEAFGFYEHIKHPELWVTDMSTKKDLSPRGFIASDASIELKALHAIGQQGVKQKNGMLRSQLYATDAIFYPFADTPKKGIEILKPYLIKYSSHGAIIDSVQTYTHDVIYLDKYILEFTKFAVAWRYNEMPGQANGKGIVLRKRLDNGELRIFRHIGLHNFDG